MNNIINIDNSYPALRFPKFKDNWFFKKLGEVTFKVGYRNKDKIQYPIYSINNKEGFLPQSEQFDGMDSNERGYDISLYKIITDNTFAFNPARINVGSIGYSGKLNNIIVSSLYVCFKTTDEINDEYLMIYLKSEMFNKAVLRTVEGGVRNYLFYENFSSLEIPITTFPEQTKIASFVSTIDKKLRFLKKKKSLLEKYKKGVMQRIFESKNSENRIRFKDDNGNDFPDWSKKKLGEISTFLDGKRKPLKQSDRAQISGIYPYYGASGIIDFVNDYIFDEELILLGEDGENIISRNLPLAFKVSGKYWVNNHAHVIKPNKDIDIDFLTLSLERISYLEYNTGTAQPKLNQEVCRGIVLNIPPIGEQIKIGNLFKSIDQKISNISSQISKTEQWKKGLLQKLFV